jgi:hypothetical protein
MRTYQKPRYEKGPTLQAVTAQVCVSPFIFDCEVPL